MKRYAEKHDRHDDDNGESSYVEASVRVHPTWKVQRGTTAHTVISATGQSTRDSAFGNVDPGQNEVMRLTSADGAQVLVEVVGYQFADSNLGVDDANWLQIRAEVSSGEGNWGFTDPCLTTSEAVDLLGWLERVADGVIPTVVDPTGDWRRGMIDWSGVCDFIEPCFSLSLAAQSPTHRVIRVHFSHEGLPSWIDAADIGYDLHRFFVRLNMEVGDLVRAIDEWRHEIAAFPARPGSA